MCKIRCGIVYNFNIVDLILYGCILYDKLFINLKHNLQGLQYLALWQWTLGQYVIDVASSALDLIFHSGFGISEHTNDPGFINISYSCHVGGGGGGVGC